MALNLDYDLNKKYLHQIKNKESLQERYKIKKEISNLIIKPNKLLLAIFSLSLIFLVILYTISVKTEIYLNNLQKDIIKITESNYLLNVKLEEEKNLNKVEKLAKKNLKMKQITSSEVTYLKSKSFNNSENIGNFLEKSFKINKVETLLGY
ncbi:MAG: hypothetical protein KatS3mg068_2281 [Candidatus Sericytochromatia bacterium]|nr:MAG: hypothetical protein KatS3mg068_2281 [Candidatus Sericytochromatia bacterium]